MVEPEGRFLGAPGSAQAQECSPCCMDTAPAGGLGDRQGMADTEPVFKKEGEEVQLAGPESS